VSSLELVASDTSSLQGGPDEQPAQELQLARDIGRAKSEENVETVWRAHEALNAGNIDELVHPTWTTKSDMSSWKP
jgi:hypothetical protein